MLKLFGSIVRSVLTHAVAPGFGAVLDGIDILSTFSELANCTGAIEVSSDCTELGVVGAEIVLDNIAEPVAQKFIALGNAKFRVSKTDNGLLIASKSIPKLIIPKSIVTVENYFPIREIGESEVRELGYSSIKTI